MAGLPVALGLGVVGIVRDARKGLAILIVVLAGLACTLLVLPVLFLIFC